MLYLSALQNAGWAVYSCARQKSESKETKKEKRIKVSTWFLNVSKAVSNVFAIYNLWRSRSRCTLHDQQVFLLAKQNCCIQFGYHYCCCCYYRQRRRYHDAFLSSLAWLCPEYINNIYIRCVCVCVFASSTVVVTNNFVATCYRSFVQIIFNQISSWNHFFPFSVQISHVSRAALAQCTC